MNGKRWALCFGLIAVLCAAALLWQRYSSKPDLIKVSQNGVTIEQIDLKKVEAPYTIRIKWEDGYNVLTVTPETVWVSEANCDNQICVDHGPLEKKGTAIACLPHRLIIFWAESEEAG